MIIRYRHDEQIAAGWLADGAVTHLADTVSALLHLSRTDLRSVVDSRTADQVQVQVQVESVEVLAPIDGLTELWAAGVTYETSQSARITESETSGDVYAKVYDAERPELFFKSVAWRVVGDGGTVRVRADSTIDVPEPELAVLINTHREIVGYAICNDMSSRSIEAENPLYLPQAKIFRGSSALGPGLTPAWLIDDPYDLSLHLTITRDENTAWQGSASVRQLHRRLEDLVDWLYREVDFPDGAWLSTGTCLVPDLPFTLAGGDRITIEIPALGTLTNLVDR